MRKKSMIILGAVVLFLFIYGSLVNFVALVLGFVILIFLLIFTGITLFRHYHSDNK